MPAAQNITRAYLQEIVWTKDGQVKELKNKFDVQFNPASLKVSYTNQKSGGEQGSPIQFVGRGTTSLSLELLFDVSAGLREGSGQDDVRYLTQRVTNLIKPDPENNVSEDQDTEQIIPPGVRFQWGNFLFDGVVDSINETLDFFSSEGKPLRSTITLAISRQDIFIQPVKGNSGGAGATPQTQASAGDTLQQLAARLGRPGDWKAIASFNGIENPRLLAPGALIDMNASASFSAGASLSAGASIGGGASAGFGIS